MIRRQQWLDAGLYVRESLQAGATIDGPAIVAERNATTVVEPGWQARLTAAGALELQRIRARVSGHALGTQVDPVMLEVFNNLFMSIAEQMGVTLEKTAYSTNIKERLDFSCAVFDPDGGLDILFDGKSLAETKIGYVFQNYREAMFPWMRTIDNIAYPLKLEGKSKAEVGSSRTIKLGDVTRAIANATR